MARPLKSECRRHTPSVTLPRDTTTKYSAWMYPFSHFRTRNRGSWNHFNRLNFNYREYNRLITWMVTLGISDSTKDFETALEKEPLPWYITSICSSFATLCDSKICCCSIYITSEIWKLRSHNFS